MWAPWRVVEKKAAGASTATFVLEPADETPVTPGQPGQFVSVRIPERAAVVLPQLQALASR